MAKPNPLWSQFGAASSMCKAGSMCNNHYPIQSSQVQQSNNLTSVYGMFYDQNLRQEPSRSSGGHIGNGSHYLPSQQVALPPTMPLSQQGYVGLPFSAYSLPLTHNFIHRPVAHVDPQNYQYFTGSHNYGSSTTRRVTPYQRSVRPERRRTQESVRRGFEIIRPEMETSRRNVPLRNMLDPVASITTTGMPQSPVVSVGAANESMTVRQFLSSWRDRDEELPERTGVVGHNDNYGLGSLTIPTQNAPPTQAETSSFMGTSNQESGWAGEERRIERISNPDMIPLMYPIPQMQPSHLTQAESVQQISQAHLGSSAGLPPPPWQCLDLQGQQCYGGPPSTTDYRTDETRPSIQPQRHYNINSSIETGEIFDDINGTRESRHRSSSNSLQSHTLSSNRSNNVFPSEERLWESALHPPQNLNYSTMSGESVGSHSVGSLVNVGYYDSYVADTGNMVASTLRNEITPPPAHPDTTTRDPQENVEQVTTEPPLSSEEINLSLAQAAENVTTQQLCFPESNNDCQNEANNRLNVSHNNEDTINKIDDEFENDIIQSTLHDTIIKEDLQLDTNENSKIKNNNIINESDNRVSNVGSLSSPADTHTDDNVSDSTNDRSESPTKHAVNHANQLPSLTYGDHAQPYDNIAAEQMILPNGCDQEGEIDAAVYDVCSEYQSPSETAPLELPNLLQTLKSPPSVTEQDTPSDVCDNRSFDEKLQEKVNLETVEYPIKDDVSDDFTLIEQSESEVDVKEESDEPAYDELEQLGARLWSLTQATQLHPLALPSKVDQRTCPAGSSRATSLSVSKTLLTVSHLIVKNDVTPIPNLVIKKTNTAYMSYLKNATAKQGNLLAYLRNTEKYKLNNNGFTSKTRSNDGISVKRSHQKTRTQECKNFKEGKLDVEIHHCLLCGQSYLSKDEMFKHEQSSGHRRLELVQRRAHHWAYQRATGSSDPNVPILTPKDHEFLVHLPHIPGFRNYYHHSSHFTDLD